MANDNSGGGRTLAVIGAGAAVFAAVVALAQLTIEGYAGLLLGCLLAGVTGAAVVLRYRMRSAAAVATGLAGVALTSGMMGGVVTGRLASLPEPALVQSSPSPSPSSSSSPSIPPGSQPLPGAEICRAQGGFENPADGRRVTRTTTVDGSAAVCDGQTLWVFLQAADRFYVHGRQSLDVDRGRWSSRSGAVMCGSYRPDRVAYFLMVTGRGVTEQIKVELAKAPVDQTAEFPELPSGIVLDKVNGVVDCG